MLLCIYSRTNLFEILINAWLIESLPIQSSNPNVIIEKRIMRTNGIPGSEEYYKLLLYELI